MPERAPWPPAEAPEPVSLLLDCDTGIDDALALAYLCSQPHVELVAVSSTPGNVGAEQVARNNLALLELCGRPDVPVAIGARAPLEIPLVTTPETHGPQGIGYAELPEPRGSVHPGDAAELWIEAARARPGELTALLTAPADQLRPRHARGAPAPGAAARRRHHGRQLLLPRQHHAHR